VLFSEILAPIYQDMGEINGEGCGRCEMAAGVEREVAG
jgi:hypothetical protein